MSYTSDAISHAQDTVLEYIDDVIEMLVENGEASNDLHNDYPNGDSYHRENHVDKDYSLGEAAECLDDLSDYEETDSGLWDGLEPRRAIAAQAAYAYGNAVISYFRDIIENINDQYDEEEIIEEIEQDFQDELAEIEDEDDRDEFIEDKKKEAVEYHVRAVINSWDQE